MIGLPAQWSPLPMRGVQEGTTGGKVSSFFLFAPSALWRTMGGILGHEKTTTKVRGMVVVLFFRCEYLKGANRKPHEYRPLFNNSSLSRLGK